MIAQRVVPAAANELGDFLRECNALRRTVAVVGGNTLRGMGAPVAQAGIEISTERFNDIVSFESRDLTCAAGAGVRLRDLNERLAQHGQFVPFDAPLASRATIGGTLAAGWLGARRHAYFRVRDLVIGTQVVLADGTIARAGGMVVKNVTGYDMSKLYVGSFGTLAVIVQANFKTLPLPPRRRVLVAGLPEATRARTCAQIAALAIAPAAAFCVEGFRKEIDGEDAIDGRAVLLFEGSAGLIERATREARSALGRAGVPQTLILDEGAAGSFERVVDAPIANVGERSVTYRMLGDPSGVEARAIAARDAAHRHELYTDVLFDVMNGDLFLRVSQRDSRRFAERIAAYDADLRSLAPRRAVVSGDSPARFSLDPWGEPPPAIETMHAIKMRFDPHRILNPGRFVGGI